MRRYDPQFGEMTWHPQALLWAGRVSLPSGSSLAVYVHASSEADDFTEDARSAFNKMMLSEAAARQFAAEELLTIHNEEWSEGKSIDQEEFISRTVLASIEVFPDGDAEISFGDDGLFWGHEIGVRYRGGVFTEAVVEG